MLTAVCPKNSRHKKFVTVAHVMEEWLVDEHGNYTETTESLQTSFPPDPGNIWTCAECGSQAMVTR